MKQPHARLILLIVALLIGSSHAQDLADRVTEYTLDNGMRVLFVTQDAAPVIAINLMFDVGGADEPDGLGGVAHMVEHMAFKGTRSIGSYDPIAEQNALAALEVAELALQYAEKNGTDADIQAAQAYFEQKREAAQALGAASAIDDLLSSNGGINLNASTSYDRTSYVLELPANRLELYARIYADVLSEPVFRYFYEERDVVREERRSRNEDDPQGVLFEAFLAEAFQEHPYGRSLIGSAQEIESYSATEAQAIFDLFYKPHRAVLAIVGDVNPEEDIKIIERYFGALPAGEDFSPTFTPEPAQTVERRVTVTYDAEPQLVIGYHKPTYPNPDAYTLDLVDAILSSGRTSRLYRRMVTQDQTALDVFTTSAYPGNRFDNLFLFYGLPRAPHTTQELEAAFYDEIETLKTTLVSPEELEKVKNQVRASTIRSLASNSGLASNLAYNELFAGGWERLTDDLALYEAVTAEDIQRVVQTYFTEQNRTVGTLVEEQ